MRAPLWIMPGQPDGVITVHLGYGRRSAGRVGNDEPVGFNAYEIRTSIAPWSTSRRASAKNRLSSICSRPRNSISIWRSRLQQRRARHRAFANARRFLHGEDHARRARTKHATLYDPECTTTKTRANAPNYAWGMAIDLNNCVGCNACTIACQSENNIPDRR